MDTDTDTNSQKILQTPLQSTTLKPQLSCSLLFLYNQCLFSCNHQCRKYCPFKKDTIATTAYLDAVAKLELPLKIARK